MAGFGGGLAAEFLAGPAEVWVAVLLVGPSALDRHGRSHSWLALAHTKELIWTPLACIQNNHLHYIQVDDTSCYHLHPWQSIRAHHAWKLSIVRENHSFMTEPKACICLARMDG